MRHAIRSWQTLSAAAGAALLVAASVGCGSASPRSDFFSVRAAGIAPTPGSGRIARFERAEPQPSAFAEADLADAGR